MSSSEILTNQEEKKIVLFSQLSMIDFGKCIKELKLISGLQRR